MTFRDFTLHTTDSNSLAEVKREVICDSKTLSRRELERLTRRYTTEIAVLLSPDGDIPAPDMNRILNTRGVVVVPDILANAGGVTVSYFEWVQGLQRFLWEEDEINRRLETILLRAYRQVYMKAKQEWTSTILVGAMLLFLVPDVFSLCVLKSVNLNMGELLIFKTL